MKWSTDALLLIQAAPPAVQSMIRDKVEMMATTQGFDSISLEFVSELMQSRHRGSTPDSATEISEPDLEPFYACETGDVITSAFSPTNDVHVFSSGQTLSPEEGRAVWKHNSQKDCSRKGLRSLYVHVPFCRSRCVFCPFYANQWTPSACEEYIDALRCEIEQLAETPLGGLPIDAVYFGGGTPSDLSADQLTSLLSVMQGRLSLSDDAEITLEGRIWGTRKNLIQAGIDGGVNRFSIGVQSFDTSLRKSIGRNVVKEKAIRFLNELAETHASVVIDLIYGLPGQTLALWQEDLRILMEETQVHGVDLYRLKSVPGNQMEEMIGDEKLPECPEMACIASMFTTGVETLNELGWERLSIPHWRISEVERNVYNHLIKAGHDCIPIGCGAGGRVGSTRFFQISDLSTYYSSVFRGEKPIASALQLGKQSAIVDQFAEQLEQGYLAPGKWLDRFEALQKTLYKLWGQWERAGLLVRADQGYALTLAGQFWSVQMGVRLAHLVEEFASFEKGNV